MRSRQDPLTLKTVIVSLAGLTAYRYLWSGLICSPPSESKSTPWPKLRDANVSIRSVQPRALKHTSATSGVHTNLSQLSGARTRECNNIVAVWRICQGEDCSGFSCWCATVSSGSCSHAVNDCKQDGKYYAHHDFVTIR